LDFEAGDGFDLFLKVERGELEDQFTSLKNELLGRLLAQTDTLSLQPRFERAANEAAAVAWTTDYPLLVFPVLFEELTRGERARENRQLQIRTRTEKLMEYSK